MSRAWKPLPTNLPGWDYLRMNSEAAQYWSNPKRRKKLSRSQRKKLRKRFARIGH